MLSKVKQDYWDNTYRHLPLHYNPENVLFRELFERYLRPHGSCFEVGCYPGNFLVHLSKHFDFVVNGIDTTPYVLDRLPQHLIENGVKVGKLYHDDFLSFETREVYDVVCSFGFVEHFINFEQVIEKHIQLVKPGGILLLSCPNFRWLQYVFHRLLDPVNLQRHVLKAMNLRRWRDVLENNGMEVIHQGYYRTAGFWVDTPRSRRWAKVAIKWIKWTTNQLDRQVKWSNPLLSPHMISFSRKDA